MKRMTFSGLDEVRAELDKAGKKCCFVCLGHYCNWEYVASLQYWFPEIHCGQIYHPYIIRRSISYISAFADSLVVSPFR